MTEPLSIIWHTHGDFIIRDIDPKWHNRVCNYLVENYVKPRTKFLSLIDEYLPVNEEEYRMFAKHILQNECSIVVMNEDKEIFGVALLMWMTKIWRTWTAIRLKCNHRRSNYLVQLCQGMVYEHAENFNGSTHDSLNVFHYCLNDQLREDKLFMCKWFSSIIKVARHMKMPKITYIALSVADQREAKAAGFKEASRCVYSLFKYKGMRPFARLREIDENFAVLYMCYVESLVPYYKMTVFEPQELELPAYFAAFETK
ncbi:uncharacterized protein LOC119668777 isoform X1 [Teleopsis dalmanni]|uniref:uncharacterized protein LOC119667840 isoform X1 n=1 Tax=Teleopsis dalmanni TaxID=139649 RepID=UPI0018CE9D95|nr:uncharacterized protein LOC119667840 isoform X1 [Teleopsis dalmanni]XP_037934335.1 uncharacterized protein LOC119668777 isoform X1 [Teleopsis dalmanni]